MKQLLSTPVEFGDTLLAPTTELAGLAELATVATEAERLAAIVRIARAVADDDRVRAEVQAARRAAQDGQVALPRRSSAPVPAAV